MKNIIKFLSLVLGFAVASSSFATVVKVSFKNETHNNKSCRVINASIEGSPVQLGLIDGNMVISVSQCSTDKALAMHAVLMGALTVALKAHGSSPFMADYYVHNSKLLSAPIR